MGQTIESVFSLLVEFPGNFAFHVVVNFSILNALFMTSFTSGVDDVRIKRNTITGLSTLLAIRLLQAIISGLLYPLLSNLNPLLPLIDWVVTTISIILLIWLWILPLNSRNIDSLLMGLGLLFLGLFIICMRKWDPHSNFSRFNQSSFDNIWNGLSIALLIVGMILMIAEKPLGYGIGLGMLLRDFQKNNHPKRLEMV